MADNLPTMDLTQTVRVQPVPVPEIPLEIYSPATFGAGLAAGVAQAGEHMAQVATMQRHFDANAAAMDAEDQFSRYTADKLVTYREQIQNLSGADLKRATRDYQQDIQQKARDYGAGLTDQIAAQEYAKRAGTHMDRAYQVIGEAAFQRDVQYRAQLIASQHKLAVDAAGLVTRGPDGMPVGGKALPKDLDNAAGALKNFATSVHNDPSMLVMKDGVLVLNDAGKAAITETTVSALDNMLMAYVAKPQEGLAMLKMIYPGTSQTVADVLGSHASHWLKTFTDAHQGQFASGLGYEAQKQFGQADRKAQAWIEAQVKAKYPGDPETASAISAAAVNQYTHFANQKIQRVNALEAEQLKNLNDRILDAGGWEELQSTPAGAAYIAALPEHLRKKGKDYSDVWKSNDPTSSFQRSFAIYQSMADANPLHAFDNWTDTDLENAALSVGPKLAPALRKMVHESKTKKDLDKPGIAAERLRVNSILMAKYNIQKDPTDPFKPDFANTSYEDQMAFTVAQKLVNAYFKDFEADPKNRTGAPDPFDVDKFLRRVLQPVKVEETMGSIMGFPWATGKLAPLPTAAVKGRQLLVPYEQIAKTDPEALKRIEDTIRARGVPAKLAHFKDHKELVSRMYQHELDVYYRSLGVHVLAEGAP